MKKENLENNNITPEEATPLQETSVESTTEGVTETTNTPPPKKKNIAIPLICVFLALGIIVFAFTSLTKNNTPTEEDTDSVEESIVSISESNSLDEEDSIHSESSQGVSSSTLSSSSTTSTTSSRPAVVSSTPSTVSSTTPPPVSSTAPPPAWVCTRAEADSICATVNAWLEANGGVNWDLSWENNEGYTVPTQVDLFPSYNAVLNNVQANAELEVGYFGSAGYVKCVVVPYGNTYLIAVVRG